MNDGHLTPAATDKSVHAQKLMRVQLTACADRVAAIVGAHDESVRAGAVVHFSVLELASPAAKIRVSAVARRPLNHAEASHVAVIDQTANDDVGREVVLVQRQATRWARRVDRQGIDQARLAKRMGCRARDSILYDVVADLAFQQRAGVTQKQSVVVEMWRERRLARCRCHCRLRRRGLWRR